MARKKLIPDGEVHDIVLTLVRNEGEKAVSFARVARLTGLAPATLVQRFGNLETMVQTALHSGWHQAETALTQAAKSGLDAKGAVQILKALPCVAALLSASQRDETLRQRAQNWRVAVEAALSIRLGEKAKSAPVLFMLWQGQGMWQGFGAKPIKLKSLLKKLP